MQNTIKTAIYSIAILISIMAIFPNKAHASNWYDPLCLISSCGGGSSNNNNNNNNSNPLVVSCNTSANSVETGETVTWRATASGGNNRYSYVWEGSEGLSGTQSYVYKSYNNSGTKTGRVTVTSGNQVVTKACSDVSVTYASTDNNNDNGYDDLNVSCHVSDDRVEIGDSVTWRATVSGGTGSYRYDWSGSEGLDGNSKTETIEYDRTGTKTAEVTVTSGSQTVTEECSDDVRVYSNGSYNDDYYYNDNNYYNNSMYYWENNYSQLKASCYPSNTNVDVGDSITWRATVSGGDGDYSYNWTGSDSLRSRSSQASVRYNSSGNKGVTLRINSGDGQTITRDCGTVSVKGDDTYSYNNTYNNNYNNTYAYGSALTASCYPSTNSARVGQSVSWGAAATGGNGIYTYTWGGVDGVTGYASDIFKAYTYAGNKTAYVTVTSGGNSVTAQCSSGIYVSNSGNGSGTGTGVKSSDTKVDGGTTASSNSSTKYTANSRLSAAAAYALDHIPWGVISWLLVFILICIIIYLTLYRHKAK